jgi:hypothetical protein
MIFRCNMRRSMSNSNIYYFLPKQLRNLISYNTSPPCPNVTYMLFHYDLMGHFTNSLYCGINFAWQSLDWIFGQSHTLPTLHMPVKPVSHSSRSIIPMLICLGKSPTVLHVYINMSVTPMPMAGLVTCINIYSIHNSYA